MILAHLTIAPAKADDPLSRIRALMTKDTLICGNFTQSKFLRALTRPLVSQGQLLFAAGKGVLWQVLEPFATRVLVKGDALIKWDDKGVPRRVSFGQTPIFRALSQVFLGVFAGDINRLRKTFEIAPDVSQSTWQITLKPRDAGFAAIIATIRVSGGRFVDELLIAEGRGDQTLIRFSSMNAGTCQLTDAEKGYFAH
jgi:hypothetical protein